MLIPGSPILYTLRNVALYVNAVATVISTEESVIRERSRVYARYRSQLTKQVGEQPELLGLCIPCRQRIDLEK